jgi:hypothetical protein
MQQGRVVDLVGAKCRVLKPRLPVQNRTCCLSTAEIFAIVKGSMTITGRQQFEEVCMLMESLYSQE